MAAKLHPEDNVTEMPRSESFERNSGTSLAKGDAVPVKPVEAKPGRWAKRGAVALVRHRCINLGRIARSGSSRIRSRVSVQALSLPG
jgi:hypothetical protein